MISYTIMEYDIENKRYRTLGFAEGLDPNEAKQNYIKKHDWRPQEKVMLFAKPPICR